MKLFRLGFLLCSTILMTTLSYSQSVELSLSASSGSEAGATIIIVTATASANVTGNQTVDVSVSGTGITGSDYSLSNSQITILDGTDEGTVNFVVQDDLIDENTETATISISNPSAGITLGATTSADVTITDNDDVTVTFNSTGGTYPTSVGVNANITLTFSEPIQNANGTELTNPDLAGILTLKLNNAAGADVGFSATINAGKTVITVNPSNNNIGNNFFGNQQYYIALSGSSVETQASEINVPASNSTFTAASLNDPSDNVPALVVGAVTGNSIEVTWTGQSIPQLPERYLLLAKQGGSFSNPTDASPPPADDTNLADGAAAVNILHQAGTNTYTFTGLSAATVYDFRLIPYNNIGTATQYRQNTNTLSASTSCAPPTGQANTITFANTNAVSMDVNWTRGTPSGNGVIVIARAVNAVSFVPANGDNYSGEVDSDFDGALDQGGGNKIVFRGNGTSVNVSNLNANTTYHFAVYEYNNAGNCYNLVSPAVNQNQTTGIDTNTSITGGTSASNTLSSLASSTSEIEVFSFTVTDQGGDGLATDISAMTFNEIGGEVSNISHLIAGAELRDDDGNIKSSDVTINTNNIAITNIPRGNGDLGQIDEGTSKTYSLYIWFNNPVNNSDGLRANLDGKQLIFSISDTDIATDAGDSQFNPGESATSEDNGAPNNIVSVVATELRFIQQPTDVFVLTTMSPAVTVEATDNRGNRDLDYAGNVELSSTGTLQSTPAATFTNGLGSYGSIVHTVNQNNRTLSTNNSTPALTETGSSNQFDILGPAGNSDIVLDGGFTYPTNINYINFQEAADITTSGTSIEVGAFRIRDGGAGNDGDVFSTTLTSISFNITNAAFIRRAALYADLDDNGSFETELAESSPTGTSITFNSFSLTAPDDGTIDFAIRASFTTNVIDNVQFTFEVTTTASDPTGSGFDDLNAGGAITSTIGNNNRIEVVATQQQFTVQPDALEIQGTPIVPQPVVIAIDGNNNQDLDYNGSVTVTNGGSLPMANTPTAYSSGELTFSGFTYNASGNGTLTIASSGLTNIVSNAVLVDGVAPTAVINDNHVDNIVRDADNVVISIIFTENDQIDEVNPPEISIGGVVTNQAMTKITNLEWTYNWNVPSGNDGPAAVTINATDRAGNALSTLSSGTGPTIYTIDNTAPEVTSINRLNPSPTAATSVQFQVQFAESVVGVDASDFSPSSGSVSNVSGSGNLYTVTVAGLGGLTTTLSLDVIGAGATINDIAGNALVNDFTGGQTYEIDNTPPEIATLSPADNSFNNPIASNLTITFNENIVVGSGNIVLRLNSDNSIVETFDVTTVSSGPNQLTINPAADLLEGTGYHVLIDAGAVTDVAGNVFAGISAITAWNFTTYAPPQVSGISNFGCVGGTITVNGQFLTGVTTVRFNGTGGNLNASFTVINDNQISATVPLYTAPITSLSGTLFIEKTGGGNPTSNLTTSQTVNIGPSQAVLSVGSIDNDPVCSSGTTTTSTIKIDIRGGLAPFTVNYTLGSTTNYMSGDDIVVNPPNAGPNNYILSSVTDANGCAVPIGQLTGSNSVFENVRPTVEAGGNLVTGEIDYCPSEDGITLVLNAATLGVGPGFTGSTGIQWSNNGGDGSFNNATNLNAQYTIGTNDLINGSVTLSLTTTGNPAPCAQVSDNLIINFVSSATANPGGSGGVLEYCWDGSDPAQVQLNGSVSGGSPLWSTAGASDGTFSNVNSLNPIYTFGANDMSAEQATIRLTPSGGTCGTGTPSDLLINLTPIPTNSYLSPVEDNVCVSQSSVVYRVANNAGSTYDWTVPIIGGTSFVGDGTSTIIVDWGTDAGNYDIEVIETDANGCVSNPIILPVVLNDEPDVIFDPQLNQAQGNEVKYRLVLFEPTYPTDTVIVNEGVLGVPPYVEFFSNDGGVIRENGKWFFDTKDLELGSYEVNYIYVDNLGCSASGSAIFEVIDPSSQINNLDTEYCEGEPATIALDPVIPLGTELRFMAISTTAIDPNGNQSSYFPLIPSLTSNGQGLTAEDLGLINTGTQPSDPDYFNYPTSIPNGSFIFVPDSAANHIPIDEESIDLLITYWYGPIGVPFSLQSNSQRTTVFRRPNPLPIIENNITRVCNYDDSYELLSGNDLTSNEFNNFSFSTNAGANVVQFDGVNYSFHPSEYTNVNVIDTVEIYYTYEMSLNENGTKFCQAQDTLRVGIFSRPPRPQVNGESANELSICIIDDNIPAVEASGINPVNIPGGVNFAWFETSAIIGTPIAQGSTLGQNIINSVVGFEDFYVVQVFTGNNCFSEPVRVNIERIDNFDFTVNNSCLEPGTPLVFTKTTGTTDLQSIRWKVNGQTELEQFSPSITNNFEFQFSAPGLYDVSLEITSEQGCIDEITKPVVVTPQETALNEDIYFENFESGDGSGWVATGQNSTWAFGTPGPGNETITLGTNNGSTVWITGLNESYAQSEKSYLFSPCFDFSSLERPMISFDNWTNTIDRLDGVVVQYSTTGINGPWQRLGDFDNGQQSGINWYDRRDISSNPGDQNVGFYGWSGEKSGWVNSKHRLDVIPQAERSNVIFRFAFESSAGAQDKLDGFAIDNVFIGNRTRVVLVENFTNTSETDNTLSEANFLQNFSFGSSELVKINYHTAFPGFDPMNADNSAVVSARALYYGISNVPRARMDGAKRDDIGVLFSEWGETEYNIRSLNNSPFEIDVTTSIDGSSLEIDASLNALVDIAPNAVVHVAVIEKDISAAELDVSPGDILNGQSDFSFVVKQMLPTASGTKFPEQILEGETINVNLSWRPNVNFYDEEDVAIIVFIQDESTREVYQSSFIDNVQLPELVTSISKNADKSFFNLFPNPANGSVTITFDVQVGENNVLNIYDTFGKLVYQRSLIEGDREVKVDTRDFAGGLYHVQMKDKDGLPIRKRLMVVHQQ